MFWFALCHLFSSVVDLFAVHQLPDAQKDIHTPIRAPDANVYAEGWVRSIRQKCLEHLVVINERQLNSVLREYVHYYNIRRPHQGINQQGPEGKPEAVASEAIHQRAVLGGLLHDYYRNIA